MIDTHCHIHDESYDGDRKDVIDRAAEVGVRAMLAMGQGVEDNNLALSISKHFSTEKVQILPCFGFHPDKIGLHDPQPAIDQIRTHRDQIFALGEIGIDYWIAKEDAFRRQHDDVFREFVKLAIELDLPMSVHSRSAGHYAIEILAQLGAKRVCVHAFDGSAKHAERAVELGYYFSVPATTIHVPQKHKLVERVPLEKLLLETDSPVMAPERGARNEPMNVQVSAQAIAQLKNCSVEEVIAQTTKNAIALFALDQLQLN